MTQSPMLSTLHHLMACHSWWRPILSACMPIKVTCWKYSRFKIQEPQERPGSEIQSTAWGSMASNPTNCFCALHSNSQKGSLLMLYPDIVCDLSMPLYVTQKETQGTKHIMIHSSSNWRYLVTNYANYYYCSYRGSLYLGSFFNHV